MEKSSHTKGKSNTGASFEEAKKMWNEKILDITMKIKNEHPELSNFITEIPLKTNDQKSTEANSDITLKNLQEYYESLNSILKNYLLEHRKDQDEEK